jgi:hypothetical protein
MANFSKITPVGLDVSVEAIKDLVYGLKDYWNVELDGYGRCYPIFGSDKTKQIQYFKGKDEYVDLLNAEGNKFFFTHETGLERTVKNHAKAKVDLYFILDVSKIYPNIQHRADEEVRLDVLNMIEKKCSQFAKWSNVITDIDKVFNRYGYVKNNYKTSNSDDLHPYHCFRIELELVEFNINQIKCN